MSLLKRIIYWRVCLLVLASVLTSVPLQSGPFQSEGATSSAKPAEKTGIKDAYSGLFPEIVATVNGEPIYGRELERSIRGELMQIGSPKWTDLREEYRGNLVYNSITALVNSKLIYDEAVANGITVTDAEVQDEFLKITQMFKSDEEMNDYLRSRDVDQETAVAEIHKNLIVTKFIDQAIRKKVSITREEATDYYAANPNSFTHPDIVRTSQILIESGDTEASQAKARQLAQSILDRAQKGEDFAELARKYSKSPTASQGGDIGFSDRESLAPEYADLAFSLPVGGIKMIQMDQGYRIVKVTDKKKAGKSTFLDAEESLVEFLKNEKINVETTKLINRLRDSANIEILIPAGVPLDW